MFHISIDVSDPPFFIDGGAPELGHGGLRGVLCFQRIPWHRFSPSEISPRQTHRAATGGFGP